MRILCCLVSFTYYQFHQFKVTNRQEVKSARSLKFKAELRIPFSDPISTYIRKLITSFQSKLNKDS